MKGNIKHGVKWGLLLGMGYFILKLLQNYLMGKTVSFHMDVYYWIGGVLVGFFEENHFGVFYNKRLKAW